MSYVKRITTLVLVCLAMLAPVHPVHARSVNRPAQTTISVSTADGFQAALASSASGDVIELAAGTYTAPQGGFNLDNLNKSLTIQAASGASVTLSGNSNQRQILHSINASPSSQLLRFANLIFDRGGAESEWRGGAVTLANGKAFFENCTFQNNTAAQTLSAGAVFISTDAAYDATPSEVGFVGSTFTANTAAVRGGAILALHSTVTINQSSFTGNRTNLAAVSATTEGGAVWIGNSRLSVNSSLFDGNQAGYVGGAIYAIGAWEDPVTTPTSTVNVFNSTFQNNAALRGPAGSNGSATEAGAIHAENQTTLTISFSKFLYNQAMNGGAVNLYRAIGDVNFCTFKGNQATGSNNTGTFGGAISAISSDDGVLDARAASLTVKNSYFTGAPFASVSDAAGAIYATGDTKMGLSSNPVDRATVVIENSIFSGVDVQQRLFTLDNGQQTVEATGIGGAVVVDLVNLTVNNSLFVNNDAFDCGGCTRNASGGALVALRNSLVNITSTTFAKNTAGMFGGAIFGQGSEINVSGSNLIENQAFSTFPTYGNASFITVAGPLGSSGVFQNNAISNMTDWGPLIFDGDAQSGAINSVQYNSNTLFSGASNKIVYQQSWIAGKKVSELNDLVIVWPGRPSIDKATVNNTGPASAPTVGKILAAPSLFYPSIGLTSVPLVYAWSGSANATVDGQAVSGYAGETTTAVAGTHTLRTNSTNFTTLITQMQYAIFLPIGIK